MREEHLTRATVCRHGENSVSSIAAAAGCLRLSATDRAETLRELNSYLASAVCHLVALVLLGLLAAAAKTSDAGIKLKLQLGDGNDVFAGEEGAAGRRREIGRDGRRIR